MAKLPPTHDTAGGRLFCTCGAELNPFGHCPLAELEPRKIVHAGLPKKPKKARTK